VASQPYMKWRLDEHLVTEALRTGASRGDASASLERRRRLAIRSLRLGFADAVAYSFGCLVLAARCPTGDDDAPRTRLQTIRRPSTAPRTSPRTFRWWSDRLGRATVMDAPNRRLRSSDVWDGGPFALRLAKARRHRASMPLTSTGQTTNAVNEMRNRWVASAPPSNRYGTTAARRELGTDGGNV